MSLPAFSDDVLDIIFRNLPQKDLFQCQKVCHSWYTPAHLLILKKVAFIKKSKVDSFLKAIDNPLYPKAIKQLELGSEFTDDWIDATRIKQLFARLPGLEELLIMGGTSFMEDKSIHETIRKECRKLRQVHYAFSDWQRGTDPVISQLVKTLQDTLTDVELMPEETVDSLSGFSHLKSLSIEDSKVFVNFEACLPLFEQQEFTLKSVRGTMQKEDKDNFMSVYQDNQLLVGKLSALKELKIYDDVICPNSFKFITQYLTGLSNYQMHSNKMNWSDQQIDSFCSNMLDFVRNLEKSRIDVTVEASPLTKLLPVMIQKIFQRSPHYVDGKLMLNIDFDDSAQFEPFYSNIGLTTESVKMRNDSIKRSATIRFNINQAVLDCTKDALTSSNINILRFNFSFDVPNTVISIFQEMLNRLPAVKQVILHVLGYSKSVQLKNPTKQYNQVEFLEINASSGLRGRTMDMLSTLLPKTFENFLWMFPRVKYLKLHYMGGFWTNNNQLEVPLQYLNLERLDLDVTSVLKKTQHATGSFFVLCIQTDNQQYLYQVSLDYLKITRIDKELQGRALVTINVASLKFIKLYLYKDIVEDCYDCTYLNEKGVDKVLEACIILNQQD